MNNSKEDDKDDDLLSTGCDPSDDIDEEELLCPQLNNAVMAAKPTVVENKATDKPAEIADQEMNNAMVTTKPTVVENKATDKPAEIAHQELNNAMVTTKPTVVENKATDKPAEIAHQELNNAMVTTKPTVAQNNFMVKPAQGARQNRHPRHCNEKRKPKKYWRDQKPPPPPKSMPYAEDYSRPAYGQQQNNHESFSEYYYEHTIINNQRFQNLDNQQPNDQSVQNFGNYDFQQLNMNQRYQTYGNFDHQQLNTNHQQLQKQCYNNQQPNINNQQIQNFGNFDNQQLNANHEQYQNQQPNTNHELFPNPNGPYAPCPPPIFPLLLFSHSLGPSPRPPAPSMMQYNSWQAPRPIQRYNMPPLAICDRQKTPPPPIIRWSEYNNNSVNGQSPIANEVVNSTARFGVAEESELQVPFPNQELTPNYIFSKVPIKERLGPLVCQENNFSKSPEPEESSIMPEIALQINSMTAEQVNEMSQKTSEIIQHSSNDSFIEDFDVSDDSEPQLQTEPEHEPVYQVPHPILAIRYPFGQPKNKQKRQNKIAEEDLDCVVRIGNLPEGEVIPKVLERWQRTVEIKNIETTSPTSASVTFHSKLAAQLFLEGNDEINSDNLFLDSGIITID